MTVSYFSPPTRPADEAVTTAVDADTAAISGLVEAIRALRAGLGFTAQQAALLRALAEEAAATPVPARRVRARNRQRAIEALETLSRGAGPDRRAALERGLAAAVERAGARAYPDELASDALAEEALLAAGGVP